MAVKNIKAKVLQNFRDKYTNEGYRAGDVIEVTGQRFQEILKKGAFVQGIEKEDNKGGKPAKVTE